MTTLRKLYCGLICGSQNCFRWWYRVGRSYVTLQCQCRLRHENESSAQQCVDEDVCLRKSSLCLIHCFNWTQYILFHPLIFYISSLSYRPYTLKERNMQWQLVLLKCQLTTCKKLYYCFSCLRCHSDQVFSFILSVSLSTRGLEWRMYTPC